MHFFLPFVNAAKLQKTATWPARLMGKLLVFCLLLIGQGVAMGQSIQVISVTPSKTSLLTGEDFIYTIQFNCAGIAGTGNCSGQQICATLPAAIANNNVLLFGGTFATSTNYNTTTGEACWTMGALATGTTGEVTFSCRFRENFTPNNTTAVLVVGGVTAATVTATTDPRLEANKTGPSTVGADGTITYNLSIANKTNNGSSRGACITYRANIAASQKS